MVSPNVGPHKEGKLLYPDHHLIRCTKSGFRPAHVLPVTNIWGKLRFFVYLGQRYHTPGIFFLPGCIERRTVSSAPECRLRPWRPLSGPGGCPVEGPGTGSSRQLKPLLTGNLWPVGWVSTEHRAPHTTYSILRVFTVRVGRPSILVIF